MEPAIRRSIDAVWRIESTCLIAGLARFTNGDLGRAEDLAQDALVAALELWPDSGVPDNPGAWLMAAAKNRAIDGYRRDTNLQRKYQQVARESETETPSPEDEVVEAGMDVASDDVLSLIFITCHPVLSAEASVSLTLRLVGGLSTEEIGTAFLVPKATIAQRITRAKRSLAEAKVPFERPSPEDLEERLGRILVTLVPDEPEAHGLLALMEIQASRIGARTGPDGEPVLLLEQDRGRWDHLLINRGLVDCQRAEELRVPLGPYPLQAAIAACHGRARQAEETDWTRIAALYDALAQALHSPVVELNRAVADSMAFGPEESLGLVNQLADSGTLDSYHLLPGVRGDLLQKLGRYEEAKVEFESAAALTGNQAEREVMLARAGECSG